jgi:hypothetical protein
MSSTILSFFFSNFIQEKSTKTLKNKKWFKILLESSDNHLDRFGPPLGEGLRGVDKPPKVDFWVGLTNSYIRVVQSSLRGPDFVGSTNIPPTTTYKRDLRPTFLNFVSLNIIIKKKWGTCDMTNCFNLS